MEKFKLAQNKKFTEAATDMWTLTDTAKLLNINSITGTFQVFYLQFKNTCSPELLWMVVSETVYSEKSEHNLLSTTYCQKQFLLACYTSTFKSLRTQFWHDTPLHPVHIELYFNPYVIQVHRVVYSILQSHLIVFRSSCDVWGFVICTGRHIPFDIFHPHCSGGKSFPHQLWTVWHTLFQHFVVASEVRPNDSGLTADFPPSSL